MKTLWMLHGLDMNYSLAHLWYNDESGVRFHPKCIHQTFI